MYKFIQTKLDKSAAQKVVKERNGGNLSLPEITAVLESELVGHIGQLAFDEALKDAGRMSGIERIAWLNLMVGIQRGMRLGNATPAKATAQPPAAVTPAPARAAVQPTPVTLNSTQPGKATAPTLEDRLVQTLAKLKASTDPAEKFRLCGAARELRMAIKKYGATSTRPMDSDHD